MPIYLKEHSYGEYVFDWSWAEAFHKSGLNYYPKMISAIPFTPITGKRIIAESIDIKRMMVKALEKILLDHKISSCHILFPNEEDTFLFNDMGWLQREGVQRREIQQRLNPQAGLISQALGEQDEISASDLAAGEFGLDPVAARKIKRRREERLAESGGQSGMLISGTGATGFGAST